MSASDIDQNANQTPDQKALNELNTLNYVNIDTILYNNITCNEIISQKYININDLKNNYISSNELISQNYANNNTIKNYDLVLDEFKKDVIYLIKNKYK